MNSHDFDFSGFKYLVVILLVTTVAVFSWSFAARTAQPLLADLLYQPEASVQDMSASLEVSLRQRRLAQEAEADRAARTVTLGFVGDIMLDRGVREKIRKAGNDFSFPFALSATTTRNFDVLFGNLEGPLSDKGVKQGSIYSFRMDTSSAPALRNAGFDILSVANNHSLDWGKTAMLDTWERLLAEEIAVLGGGSDAASAAGPVYFEKKGLLIGYVGWSAFGLGAAGSTTAGIAFLNKNEVSRVVAEAASHADVVVASFHFGEEYALEPTAEQQAIAKLAIDAGATIVVGHHPHVAQPLQRYKDGIIAYSLGNFIFDQFFSIPTMQAPVLSVTYENKKLKSATLYYMPINKQFQPVSASSTILFVESFE